MDANDRISKVEDLLNQYILDISKYILHKEKNKNEISAIQSLPVRPYLENQLVPVLIQGLRYLNRERPERPIEYLAAFLYKNREEK
nr:unnamed protein product [Spirometra erinaceieuropaei]